MMRSSINHLLIHNIRFFGVGLFLDLNSYTNGQYRKKMQTLFRQLLCIKFALHNEILSFNHFIYIKDKFS